MTLGQSGQRPTSYTGGDYLTEETAIHPSYPLYATRKRHCCHGSDGFTVISVCFFVLTSAITFALIIQIHYGSPEVTPHGAVATDGEKCSHIGIKIMQEGGSAVDVAIASLLCMTVIHPHVIGPGGSGVMLVHDHKSNQSVVIDFMSDIPSSHKSEVPLQQDTGGRSIGVPGLLRGLEYAHSKYGKVPWSSLFTPSIELAREGFNVSAHLEQSLKRLNVTQVDGITPFEKTFFPRGLMLKEGDFLKRENYADLLETISINGAESFYALDFGVEELKALRAAGSDIHVRDFENYKVRERSCIHMTMEDYTVITAPAPFGGPQLLLALEMLRNSNLTQASPALLYHSFIEAIRRSYRSFVELAVVEEPSLENVTQQLLKSNFNTSIDSTITPADPTVLAISDQAATTVSVIDTFDQYVAAVAGLGSFFGSRLMTEHGILFNNHLSNLPNSPLPEKDEFSRVRPLSLYTPVILTDYKQVCGERVVLSSPEVGAAAQIISQLIIRQKNLIDAIAQPRLTVKPGVDEVYREDFGEGAKMPADATNSLKAMNHSFEVLHQPYASVNGISKIKDNLVSMSDIRGGGVAHRLESSPKT
ncbi:glutathione hydrolase 7-like isoform X2 [Macrobrachium rosenbergii]|uniref:glutathione hydrolase 7-like isoform X2 n=1 Tax=Macrobrachium rosenbergii TaxID=79674 RepID=UPI0034D6E15C